MRQIFHCVQCALLNTWVVSGQYSMAKQEHVILLKYNISNSTIIKNETTGQQY